MRVELWFDFNKDTLETLTNLDEAINCFYHKSKVDVLFRSLPQSESNYLFHEAFQYGRRKGLGCNYLKTIFEIYFSNSDLLSSIDTKLNHFNLNLADLKSNLLHEKSKKIVLNQLEHAHLQKISVAPTITFSHGFRLIGKKDINEIKKTLVMMYEKDSGIKYCIEEDCER
ncbi:hypothetical protein [Acholeplasma granularum]|uniref:hypothetical protein n=1 Tax=Acholeplasma granularum TaxID=264635 RepID=UPI0004B6BC71|nr:hypothetical protein [Acholeplasma granularum]